MWGVLSCAVLGDRDNHVEARTGDVTGLHITTTIRDLRSTDMPERIQLSRKKGWRKPENTVVVARPSIWGNPFTIGSFKQVRGGRQEFSVNVMGGIRSYIQSLRTARDIATDEYRKWLTKPVPLDKYHHHWTMVDRHARVVERLSELRGKNLACWCPLDQPCHADVLLEIANRDV